MVQQFIYKNIVTWLKEPLKNYIEWRGTLILNGVTAFCLNDLAVFV